MYAPWKVTAPLNQLFMIAPSDIWRLTLRIKQLEEQQITARNTLICAFNQLLDLKDLGTGVHSTRLAEWAIRIGRVFGMAEAELYQLEVAAIVHDIGQIGIPDAILNKPGKLAAEERAIMQKHPEYGWSILHLFDAFQQASLYVLHHHERLDGAGYPGRLKGDDIPLGSRILAVVDAFDAMTSSRSYRGALPRHEALSRLRESSGTQFDPTIVDIFLAIAEKEVVSVFAATGTGGPVVM
jgi:HD-GYP domain-containing protein (c-di-GMP phosphodiesterase class II)